MLKNEQILVQADKKGKKGDGIKAVLTLTQELRDFQEQVEKCLEAQDIEDIKERIESFDDSLNTMYNELLDIAKGNIKTLKKDQDEIEDEIEDENENENVESHSLESILDVGEDEDMLEPVEDLGYSQDKGTNVFEQVKDYGALMPRPPVRPLR